MVVSGSWLKMALVASSVVAAFQAHAQATVENIKQRGVIQVGYRPAAAPFASKDAQGTPVGYAMEFCEGVVRRLQAEIGGKTPMPVRYMEVSVDQRLRMLRAGSIDMLCDSITDTADRRQSVDFSMPIFVDAVQIMVRAKDGFTKVADIKGKPVAVIGTTTAPDVVTQFASKNGLPWQLNKAVGADAAFGQLQLGWAAAYARDGVLLASQRVASPAPADYVILPDRLSSEPIAIGFRKGDTGMRKIVDGVITASMQDGSFQTWYDKWFLQAKPPAKPLGIPMSDELKTLIAKSK